MVLFENPVSSWSVNIPADGLGKIKSFCCSAALTFRIEQSPQKSTNWGVSKGSKMKLSGFVKIKFACSKQDVSIISNVVSDSP